MPVGSAMLLLFALLGSFAFHAVGDGYSLFLRLTSVHFSFNVLAERIFAGRFRQRHGYLPFLVGVGRKLTVVDVMPISRRRLTASSAL